MAQLIIRIRVTCHDPYTIPKKLRNQKKRPDTIGKNR